MVQDENGKFKRSYRKWSSMLRRCYDPGHPAWKYYGGRGIEVCGRWRGKEGYDNFVSDLGEPSEGLTLGRIDGTKGYEPTNCRWETWKEQFANRGKVGPAINPNSLRQKAIAAELPYSLVYQRVMWGWKIEDALTIPRRASGRHPGERLGVPRSEVRRQRRARLG